MAYFLAIDAGGTKTQCLLADEQRILAFASTGSIKLMRVGEQEATARLTSMLDEVAASAGVSLAQINRTCIGLAGLTIPAVRAWASSVLGAAVSGELLLLGDEEIALDAVFPDASGILLIAGTGSHAIGRALDGTQHRAGGWGPILGDQGGGYWIGVEALRASLRALDQTALDCDGSTPAAGMLEAIQQHWNLASLAELIELGNRRGDGVHPAPDFAALAPVVAHCARRGNPIAAAVLQRAAEELVALIALVVHKISGTTFGEDLPSGSVPGTASSAYAGRRIPVAYTGSVLSEIPAVYAALVDRLRAMLPAVDFDPTPIDPLEGALRRARVG
jgi:glucosamine kinase